MTRGPVVIMAGAGALPRELADSLTGQGCRVHILALRGFADRATVRRADAVFDIVDVRGILERLGAWAPASITLAGAVHRPSPIAFFGAAAAYRNRDYIAKVIKYGDDTLLRGVVTLLEGEGFTVTGIDSLAPGLLAGEGVFGRHAPSVDVRASIGVGFACLHAVSPFDVGQAAVVAGSRIVAMEGPEGTDAMIARAGKLWGSSRLPKMEVGLVLVKTAKSGQDLRVDIPVIGPDTVRRAAAVGFSGIALGAGRTLVLERQATVAEADRRGIFLVGIAQEAT